MRAISKTQAREFFSGAGNDVSRAHKVVRSLKAGRLWINTFGESDPAMAFGGYKQSGWGREFGAESIEAYTQTKSVMVRL